MNLVLIVKIYETDRAAAFHSAWLNMSFIYGKLPPTEQENQQLKCRTIHHSLQSLDEKGLSQHAHHKTWNPHAPKMTNSDLFADLQTYHTCIDIVS